jgi:hypothetical protein
MESRYSKTFLSDKRMREFGQGSRAAMTRAERWLVERSRGALNKESWAGKALRNAEGALPEIEKDATEDLKALEGEL